MRKNSIIAYHFSGNFGDDLTPYLMQDLFDTQTVARTEINENEDHYIIVGSTISASNQNSIICGAGFMMVEQSLYPIVPPKDIFSVRGKVTKQMLEVQGVNCPDRFGDWGLLIRYSSAAMQPVDVEYELGVIPHYVDSRTSIVHALSKIQGVKVIDLTLDTDTIIRDIMSCNKCISSSLHGLIACDSLGIQNGWCILSDNVVGAGFKFYDYFSSCSRDHERPYYPIPSLGIKPICAAIDSNYRFEFDFDSNFREIPFEWKSGKRSVSVR